MFKSILASIARIRETGHQAVFTRDGGRIRYEASGQVTVFIRIDNFYRMDIDVFNGTSGLTRQEKRWRHSSTSSQARWRLTGG